MEFPGHTGVLKQKLFCRLGALLIALLAMLLAAAPAQAANCNYATSQGSTGPANWQTYCWLDLSSYSDATARSGGGQNFSYTLPDGTVMTFNLKVSGSAVTAATSPSWTGAAVGNTAFLGISGRPIIYQTAAGTTTATISNILLTPPAGSSTITSYMFVAADAESSNEGETLRFQTNGGSWVQLDQVGPTSGSAYPTTSGIGTSTFTETGVPGTVGAYIVGSSTPTTITTTLVGGGLQGAMFAVRFASIRLNLQIAGARANAADQFQFDIDSTATGATLASGTTSGTGLGPFAAAALSTSSALPLTLMQTMTAGSVNSLTHYQSKLTCTNSAPGSPTPMPNNLVTTDYDFGNLQFGDLVSCTFINTPFPHLTLRKRLGTSGRRFAADQFIMKIDQGSTTVATTTTTGTTTTVNNGITPQYQATVGLPYTFYEEGAGATALTQYIATMACTNAATTSTVLATAPGGVITPQMGDVITCTITNTRRATNATLTVLKSSTLLSDPVNGSTDPKAIPGAILRYTFAVSNTGSVAVDSNSVILIDTLPSQIWVGTAASPQFAQGTQPSGLTFNSATDIRYSNSASPPASFASCTYTPSSAYDPAVRFICLNPKGVMAGSSGTPPSFSISVQTQLN